MDPSVSRGTLIHNIQLSLGCLFIGTSLNCVLFGVASVQVYMYANRFKRDPWTLKLIVAFIYIADLIDTLNVVGMMWFYLIRNYADSVYASKASVFFYLFPSFGVLVTLPCHLLLAWRLSYFAHRWWIVVPIVVLAFVSALAGIGSTVALSVLRDFSELHKLRPIACTWRGLGLATDLLISYATAWNLKSSRNGFSQTERSISRLANLSLRAGLITALWSAMILVLFAPASHPLGMIFAVFSITSPKVIANSTYAVILAGRAQSDSSRNSSEDLVDHPSFFEPLTSAERRKSLQSNKKKSSSTPFSLRLAEMIKTKVTAVQVVTIDQTEERVERMQHDPDDAETRKSSSNLTPSPSTKKSQLDLESENGHDEK